MTLPKIMSKGMVMVDGMPLKEFDLYDWCSHICYVQQDPIIIQGIVRDNLLLVKPDAIEKEIYEIAERVGILREIKGG